MNRIRIGNDIPIRWSIVTGRGDSQQPYDLTGKNLSLHVRAINGTVIPLEMTTEGNVVISTFYGKDQRQIGRYTIVLVENDHVEGMKTVDECHAFELVDCSCKQTGAESGNIETEQVDLSSEFPLLAIEVDSVLSEDSMNPIQNKAVAVAVRQLNERIETKQDIIEDLEEIREGASKGSTAIQDVSSLATKQELTEGLETRIAKTDIVQGLGYAIDKVMSQNAILELYADIATMIAAKLDKGVIVQSAGGAKDMVMSQKAVTDALNRKQGILIAGDNIKIEGNTISCTLNIDIVRVVDVLPETGEENHIYLVPSEQPSESDLFEEWIWKSSWERIGSAKVDLTAYAKKADVDAALAGKQDTLTAGENITIENNVISSKGGSIYPPDMNDDFNDDFAN